MKQIYLSIFYSLLFSFGILSPSVRAQDAPENIDYTLAAPGTYGANPAGADFEIALNPDILFPATPVAAEYSMIVFAPTSELSGNEDAAILEENVTGGSMLYQGSYNHTDGNTYFFFTYSGSGVNLNSYGSGAFVLSFTVDMQNLPAGSNINWTIADENSGYFIDFGVRSLMNVLGYNELYQVAGLTPLPLELMEFTALNHLDKKAELNWLTDHEYNVSHFEVERSKDGKNWQGVGQVAATGHFNTSAAYTFLDASIEDLSPGTIYYRLRMVDHDATFEYSKVRSIQLKGTGLAQWTVYPNPGAIGEELIVQLEGFRSTTEVMHLVLTDLSGKILMVRPVAAQTDRQTLFLRSTLVPGVYVLLLKDQAGRILQRQRLVLDRYD